MKLLNRKQFLDTWPYVFFIKAKAKESLLNDVIIEWLELRVKLSKKEDDAWNNNDFICQSLFGCCSEWLEGEPYKLMNEDKSLDRWSYRDWMYDDKEMFYVLEEKELKWLRAMVTRSLIFNQ